MRVHAEISPAGSRGPRAPGRATGGARCEAGWAERATRRSRRARKLTPRKRAAAAAGSWSTAGLACWSWEVRDDTLRLSPQAREILGLSRPRGPEGVEALLAVIHHDDRPVARALFRSAAVRGAPIDCAFRLASGGAEARSVRVFSTGAPGRPRQRLRLEGTVEDVTARRHVDDALRETAAILHVLAANTRNVVWVRDAATLALEYVNPAFDKQFGQSGANLVGLRGIMRDLFHADDWERATTALEEARQGPVSIEVRALVPAGKPRRICVRMFPVPGGDGGPGKIVGIVEDVAAAGERERYADRRAPLDRASRAATLGEMTSAIAHELGQPLFSILNYARGCLRLLEQGEADFPRLHEAALQIALYAERSGRILNGLRDLAVGGVPRTRPEDVNALVKEALGIALGEHPDGGPPTRLALADHLPRVAADPVQVVLVIVNLIRNAMEAVADRPEGRVVVRTTPDPAGVRVAVTDNGAGVAPEIGNRLFDPLVTTKADGMGMGLAVSRFIVEGHGGRIWVEPMHSTGTTVVFNLPAALKEARADA